MSGSDRSEAYVRFALDDIDNKPVIYNNGKYIDSGRRSGSARLFFGLLVFILLAVILGFVTHYSSALSSWSHKKTRREHENLTSTVIESQASFNNLKDIKTSTFIEEGLCPLGWIEVNRKCYYISPVGVSKTWLNSKQDCADRGGCLVTIKTRTELQALGLFHDRAWIGLSDRENEGTWMWEDGTELQSGFWLKGEPKGSYDEEDCVHLDLVRKKLGFNDNNCGREFSYICGALE